MWKVDETRKCGDAEDGIKSENEMYLVRSTWSLLFRRPTHMEYVSYCLIFKNIGTLIPCDVCMFISPLGVDTK